MNLREYRKNTHQTHTEDLVLLGKEGLDELNDKIDKFIRRFDSEEQELNLTQKIDGAPALFCWSKYPGYPDNSIALKGFTSGPQNSISSIEDIDNKTGGKEVKELQSLLELPKSELMNNPTWAKYSKKYGTDIESAIRDAKANFDSRENMRDFLQYGLQLAKHIPAGECWQGDCLFSKNSKKEEEINGTRYITFMPNKIVYAFSEENADYNKVKNADFGIAFHTIYNDKNGEMRQGFNVDPTRLNVPNNFYIMSPAINASKDKADYDLSALEKEYNNLKQLEQKLINDPAYEELINNSTFMNYWNTFENANLADKKQVNLNVNTFINDLKDYVNDKLSKEYNKKLGAADTDKKRQNAENKFNSDTQKLMHIIDDNKSTLTNLVNCLNSAANIKMLMWAGLKKAKNDYSTFYKSRTKGYIPSEGEGIAMSDMDGNIVKIVDRSTFSSYNRDPDIMSGFEHESLQEDTEHRNWGEISKEEAEKLYHTTDKEIPWKNNISTKLFGLEYYIVPDDSWTYYNDKFKKLMPKNYLLYVYNKQGKRIASCDFYKEWNPEGFKIAEDLYTRQLNMSTINDILKDADLSNIDLGDLSEDYELNARLKKVLGNREQEFKQFIKKLVLDHRNYDNDVHPLGVYRPERDKGSSQEKAHEFWLKNFGLDTSQRGIGSAIANALIDAGYDIRDSDEYKDTLDYDETEKLPADEQFKIHLFYEWDAAKKNFFGDYDEDDPIRSMSFREFLQSKLDYHDYEDDHEKQLIQDAIKEVTGGKGYFREMVATQMADMGKLNKFSSKRKLKLEEDNTTKTAVVAFGRFNPPHIGHRKLARAMANAAKYGEKAKIYLSHTVNRVKDPLSYDSKLRWAQKEWGDLVDVVKSNDRTAWEVLEDLYKQGYTDIIYAGGDDRIGGGANDVYGKLTTNKEHNEYRENKGKGDLVYKFNSITPLNAGERDPNSSDRETQASASLLRKLAIENNFEEFKNYVYLNERDALAMFKELRHAMNGKEESFLEACNERIEELKDNMKVIHLNEVKRDVTSLNKNNYTPEMERKLDKALDTVDPSLDAPNPNWGANDYMNNVDDYTGLYVKQTGKPSEQQVVYNKKDIVKLHGKDGEEINTKLNSLRIEDEEGNKFKLNPTGSPSVITGKATLANPTFYQEAIYSLLLTGKVKQKDLITWLRESDVEANSGIFKYINTINYNKNTFKNEWSSFIDDWGKTFEIAQNNSHEFMSKISEKLNNAEKAIILHPGVKSNYDSIADRLLKGMDDIDKSDFYLCSGNVNKITSTMLELRKNPVAYTDFMIKNTDKILGISLKKVSSSMNIVWDMQGKKDNYFIEAMLKPTNKPSQVINLYGTDGHVYNYNIRTNNAKGNITMELKENGSTDAQMGKATNAFNIFASNTPLKSKDELQRMCNNSTLKMALTLLKYITGGKNIKPGEKYKLTEEGSKFISRILNVAAGYRGTNPEGKRITAPYIKVY